MQSSAGELLQEPQSVSVFDVNLSSQDSVIHALQGETTVERWNLPLLGMSLIYVAPSPRPDAVAEDAALKIMGELAVLCVNDFQRPIYTPSSQVGGCSGGS